MLGRYDRAMRARQVQGGQTLLARAIAAIKRNNGTLFYVPQNALGDGAPNLLSAPEFAGGLTDAPIRAGLVTLSSMSGYDNAINFGHDGSALSYALKAPSHTNGLSYTLSVIVEMTDGLEPTFASTSMNSALNTFALVLFNTASNPLTYIVKSLGGAVYSVSATTVSSGSTPQAGVYKYATNDNRTFKVTGYKLELSSTATAYTPQSVLRTRGVFIDSAGVSPVTNIADVIGSMTDRSYGSNNIGQSVFTDAGVSFFGGSSRVSAGVYRLFSSDGSYSAIFTSTGQTIGKWYRLTFNVDSITSGALSIDNGAGSAVVGISGTGQKQFLLPVTTSLGITIKRTSGITDIQISGVSVQEVFGAVATQATTANKPTVQRPVANNVIRFDSSNDSLSFNLASGGSPFVRAYTRTGTVSGFTSATTSAFVLGQPTVAGRDVCAIVCAPSTITGADLTAIERWAASIGATL